MCVGWLVFQVGGSALMDAASCGHGDLAKFLLGVGARIDDVNNRVCMLHHCFCSSSLYGCILLICNNRAPLH